MTTLRIMRMPDVLAAVGVSRATIWRCVKAGDFPAPVKLGARSVGWYEHEIREWLDSRPRADVAVDLEVPR